LERQLWLLCQSSVVCVMAETVAVDYILMDPKERLRLSIEHPPKRPTRL